MTTPANELEGKVLDGGWNVSKIIQKDSQATGGTFSVGYFVKNVDGREGFMKALDFQRVLKYSTDPARDLQTLTKAFNDERDLVEICRRMDRVVTAVDSGMMEVDGTPVQYIIFERATGDVRECNNFSENFELAFSLRCLHHVSVGLKQLHSKLIAHQDVKPSNAMFFEEAGTKLGDLGRAMQKGKDSVFDHFHVAGDPVYAPPELLYGHIESDWKTRRLGTDLYSLGSMLVFFFMNQGATSLIRTKLDPQYDWESWPGTYSEVLPHVKNAFYSVVSEFSEAVPEPFRQKLSVAFMQLCEPDLNLRGHPINKLQKTPYSVERYVSLFDGLARRAELRMY